MTRAEKLFVYLLANATEAYGGREGLKKIDEILNRPEGLLWNDLILAIEQQHRVEGNEFDLPFEKVQQSVQNQMNKLLSDVK